MFDNLTGRLSQVIKTLRGQARLTEDNIGDALREVRMALLEADVALPVVRDFIASVREKALGQEVMGSLTPGQAVVGVVHRELIALMGEKNDQLNLATQPPAVVLMAGLQGSGKTTTTGKLAKWLIREGDAVKSGMVIAEIETDKATMEVEAVDEGVLARILVPGGTENVAVNTPIA